MKRLVRAWGVSCVIALALIAGTRETAVSIKCAVCAVYGPDHPMWIVLLCDTCPPDGSPQG